MNLRDILLKVDGLDKKAEKLQLRSGDIVFLPSSPEVLMTVKTIKKKQYLEDDPSKFEIIDVSSDCKCIWFNTELELQEHDFDVDCLVLKTTSDQTPLINSSTAELLLENLKDIPKNGYKFPSRGKAQHDLNRLYDAIDKFKQ